MHKNILFFNSWSPKSKVPLYRATEFLVDLNFSFLLTFLIKNCNLSTASLTLYDLGVFVQLYSVKQQKNEFLDNKNVYEISNTFSVASVNEQNFFLNPWYTYTEKTATIGWGNKQLNLVMFQDLFLFNSLSIYQLDAVYYVCTSKFITNAEILYLLKNLTENTHILIKGFIIFINKVSFFAVKITIFFFCEKKFTIENLDCFLKNLLKNNSFFYHIELKKKTINFILTYIYNQYFMNPLLMSNKMLVTSFFSNRDIFYHDFIKTFLQRLELQINQNIVDYITFNLAANVDNWNAELNNLFWDYLLDNFGPIVSIPSFIYLVNPYFELDICDTIILQ